MRRSPSTSPYTYGRQHIDEGDIEAVVRVLRSDRLTQGPAVEAFEAALAQAVGAPHAVAVANGTAALHLTGLALGWTRDDIVITTPLTFAATANAVVYCGGRPELVDVDPETGCLDPDRVADRIRALRAGGRPVRAIAAVDYAGHPCDWDALRTVAAEHELQIVDDACHSLGATYRGVRVGEGDWADSTVFSFHPVKAVTTGEGGAVVTANPEVADRVRQLRTHGITREPARLRRPEGPWYYEMQELGFNYRLSDIHAALGVHQLGRLEAFVRARRVIAAGYQQRLGGHPALTLPAAAADVEHAYHLFPVRIDFLSAGLTRATLFERLAARHIHLQVHYIPVHLHPFYAAAFGYQRGEFPEAERWYEREVSLPVYPGLSEEDLDYICAELTDALEGVGV